MLTREQAAQYRDEGWCILPGAMPGGLLALLRSECQNFIALKDAEMDRLGTDTVGISHRGKRYFVSDCHVARPQLREFLFSRLMADICRGTLGPDAYLFYDQYVVKGAEGGMRFSWHQDSGYVNRNGDTGHRPYLTCWCPLDDVSEANGTIYVLPYSRAGTRDWVPHVHDPATNDWVGYAGGDRGIPVEVPAGSIVLFSSTVFHASGANQTDQMRRVFLAQYSAAPIMKLDGSGPWAHAEPVLRHGRIPQHEPA